MDPPSSAFRNTNYNECDVFSIGKDAEYAIFYENKGQNSCGLKPKTEAQIIDEIRIGRNLIHEAKDAPAKRTSQELRISYMDSAGSVVLHDVGEKMKTDDVLLFTDVRAIDLKTWNMLAGENFSVIHMPCFKKEASCTGYGGIAILYRKELKVANHGRIFTWKLLNTEGGKVFPGVEGVFLDVTNDSLQRATRICTMFHWQHRNSKGFNALVNVANFTSHFFTKTIPPADDLPQAVHIIGRFNCKTDDLLPLLREKHPEIHEVSLEHPDIHVLTTDSSLLGTISPDPHEIFSFTVKMP